MNLPAVHPRDWTIGDLEVELKRVGAQLTWLRVSQNRNAKHFPDKLNWWHVVLQPETGTPESREGKWAQAWGPTPDIAIAKALRAWSQWTPPDFGERVNTQLREQKNKLSGIDLLKELGLDRDD